VLHQEQHRLVHLDRLDDVVIVQDEDDLARERRQVVHERGHDSIQRRRPQPGERIGTDVGGDLAHGGNDV
jgi:hypothetical protein